MPSRHQFVIAMGYLFGAAVLSRLPEEIPPSWNNSGSDTIWLGRPVVAFLLPTAAAITSVLLRRLYTRLPSGSEESPNVIETYDAIMFRCVLFVVSVHATMLIGLLGVLWGQAWASRIVPVLLGSVLMGIGNLLPRTRPNLVFGIRTSQTLSDRALWIRTHRIAGYITVLLGAMIVVAALTVPEPMGSRMSLLAGPGGLCSIPVLVLYARYHAHV